MIRSEVLFKAKRTDNKKWVYGYYAVVAAKHVIIKEQSEDFYPVEGEIKKSHGNEIIEIDYNTVCQYTGLIDKNGRKVFEGDKIKAECNDPESGYYYSSHFVFDDVRKGDIINRLGNMVEIEVTGNIYED